MSTKWSRPALQRQEVGPMLHDFGHEIYDRAEATALTEVGTNYLKQPGDFNGLAMFAHQSSAIIRSFLDDESITGPICKAMRPLAEPVGPHNNRLFTIRFEEALMEGMLSGVVTPLQLYKEIFMKENRDANSPSDFSKVSVDIEELVGRLSTPEFEAMLHQLAIGANNSLGPSSTRTQDVASAAAGASLDPFVYLRNSIFECDDDGRVTGFTGRLLARQKLDKQQERKRRNIGGESGGCPVRHARFTVIGGVATNYLWSVGDYDGLPRNQGESLISRGNRFVRTILAATIEADES